MGSTSPKTSSNKSVVVEQQRDDERPGDEGPTTTSTSSSTSSGANSKEQRTCPICLHVWMDPTVLDNCAHIFCFACILEWTRLKPECPLCKRGLQSLKHQLRCSEQEIPTWQTEGEEKNIIELRSEYELDQIKARSSYPADVEKHHVVQVAVHLRNELRALRNLSITTMTTQSVYREPIRKIHGEYDEYTKLLEMFEKGATRSELFNESAFRRVIYLKNLVPRSICPSMFNVVFNAEYIIGNREMVRAQLLPFVLREVTSLTRKAFGEIDSFMDELLDYLSGKLNRTEIVVFMKLHGIQNPHHFLNNLSHFASTGQTLRVYDQNSEFNPRRAAFGALYSEDDDVLVLNNGGADVEVVGERHRRQRRRSSSEQSRSEHRQHHRLLVGQENDGNALSELQRIFPTESRHPMPASYAHGHGTSTALYPHQQNDDNVFPAPPLTPPPNSSSAAASSSQHNGSAFAGILHQFAPTLSNYFYTPPLIIPSHQRRNETAPTDPRLYLRNGTSNVVNNAGFVDQQQQLLSQQPWTALRIDQQQQQPQQGAGPSSSSVMDLAPPTTPPLRDASSRKRHLEPRYETSSSSRGNPVFTLDDDDDSDVDEDAVKFVQEVKCEQEAKRPRNAMDVEESDDEQKNEDENDGGIELDDPTI